MVSGYGESQMSTKPSWPLSPSRSRPEQGSEQRRNQ